MVPGKPHKGVMSSAPGRTWAFFLFFFQSVATELLLLCARHCTGHRGHAHACSSVALAHVELSGWVSKECSQKGRSSVGRCETGWLSGEGRVEVTWEEPCDIGGEGTVPRGS